MGQQQTISNAVHPRRTQCMGHGSVLRAMCFEEVC